MNVDLTEPEAPRGVTSLPGAAPRTLFRHSWDATDLDGVTLNELNRSRPRSGYALFATVMVLVVAGAAVWLAATRPGSTVRFVSGGGVTESPVGTEGVADAESAARTEGVAGTERGTVVEPPASLDDFTWDVLAVGVTPDVSLPGDVVTNQLEADGLWRKFHMQEPVPVLPAGRGALFVPVVGSCDSAAQVRSIDAIPDADDSGLFAAVHLDAGCAEPTGDGTVNPEPRALYMIAVPLELAERLGGATAVQASLDDFRWEVLAVGVTPDPSLEGHVVLDQRGAESLWQMFGMQGSAPLLPPGQGALILAVSGSCDSAAQAQAVDAIPDDDAREVIAAVHFDAGCAESPRDVLLRPESRALYVIAVPVEVAESFSGAQAVVG